MKQILDKPQDSYGTDASETTYVVASAMDRGNCGQLMGACSLGSLPSHAARGHIAGGWSRNEFAKCLWENPFLMAFIQPLHTPRKSMSTSGKDPLILPPLSYSDPLLFPILSLGSSLTIAVKCEEQIFKNYFVSLAEV